MTETYVKIDVCVCARARAYVFFHLIFFLLGKDPVSQSYVLWDLGFGHLLAAEGFWELRRYCGSSAVTSSRGKQRKHKTFFGLRWTTFSPQLKKVTLALTIDLSPFSTL